MEKGQQSQKNFIILLKRMAYIVFFSVLGNADEWGEIESFAKRKEKWLRKYLELPYGVPTDNTNRIVIGNIDTEHFYHARGGILLQTLNVYSNDYGVAVREYYISGDIGWYSEKSLRKGLESFGMIHKRK